MTVYIVREKTRFGRGEEPSVFAGNGDELSAKEETSLRDRLARCGFTLEKFSTENIPALLGCVTAIESDSL